MISLSFTSSSEFLQFRISSWSSPMPISFQPLTTCILPLRFGWTIWCAIPGAQSRCFPGMLFYEVSTMLACFCLQTERCTRNLVSTRGLTGVKVHLKEQVLRFHVMEFDYDTLLQNAQNLFFFIQASITPTLLSSGFHGTKAWNQDTGFQCDPVRTLH